MSTDATNDIAEEMLLRWEESYLIGKEIPPELLCQEHPELLQQLREDIKALKQTQSLFDAADDPSQATPLLFGDSAVIEMAPSEFIDAIAHRGLARRKALQEILESLGNDAGVLRLREALILRQVLTEFQADSLLAQENIPLVLDDYVLKQPIGIGGMGTIYRAWHTRLEREVAIKILSPERLNQTESVIRFKREIRALTRLEHPNIVTAYDSGEREHVLYLVMQLVDGIDVARLARRFHRFDVADACEIVRQASQGLAYAHANGLIHRDVKPSNLMISRDGMVRVSDLGLARFVEPNINENLTDSGRLIGTIDFMSPEQGASSRNIDFRTDIYSLGATLYKLLSGQSPLGNRVGTLNKAAALMRDAVTPLHKLCPNISLDLSLFVGRMLAKNPKDRPNSMAEVEAVLKTFVHGSDLIQLVDADYSCVQKYRERLNPGLFTRNRGLWSLLAVGFACFLATSTVIKSKQPAAKHSKLEVSARSDDSIDLAKANPPANVGDTLRTATLIDPHSRDREIARRIVDLLGVVDVRLTGEAGTIQVRKEAFPASPFVVTAIQLQRNAHKLTPNDRKRIGQLESLEVLNLSYSQIDDTQFSELCKNRSLKQIQAGYTQITNRGIEALRSHPSLTLLNLWSCQSIEVSDLIDILVTMPNLSTLNLAYMQVSDDDMEQIVNLSHLESLWLEGNKNLTDKGLAKLQSMTNIKTLALAGTKLTDEAGETLVEMANLNFIQLRNTAITDQTVIKLAKLRNLQSLNLPPQSLTDASLIALSNCKTLVRLSTKGGDYSEESLEAFKAAVPECAFESGPVRGSRK